MSLAMRDPHAATSRFLTKLRFGFWRLSPAKRLAIIPDDLRQMADDGADCRYLADVAVENQPEVARWSGSRRRDFLEHSVATRQAVRQDSEAKSRSRRGEEGRHVIRPKRELTASRDGSHPFLLGKVISRFIEPKEVPIFGLTSMQIVLRSIQPVSHLGELARDQILSVRPDHPQGEIGFASSER